MIFFFLWFDGKVLFKDLNLEIMRGDKVAIIGANGVGKTTLLRCLIGELEPDAGSVKWGFGVEQGYYPQDFHSQLTPGMSALDWVMQFAPDTEGQQAVRGLLGRMLFSGDESLKMTEALSGGEVARLLMVRMMLEKNGVLIFDEPTNHLDLESVSALAEGLSIFQGTVLVVSHDRDLVSEAATRILSFTPNGLIDFLGTYDDYLESYPLPETPKKYK
jgi:ATPase subunit of ABC transporter with duplicated ATPase domains